MDKQGDIDDGEKVAQAETNNEYPPLKVVLPCMAAIWLAFFVVALDRTIIGTAVPTITKQFDSFGDIAWYEAGFLLPLCVLQLSVGRVYKYYSTKWVLIISVAIFEFGSIICAAAPNSAALIVGRVVTGVGGAGIGPGAFLLIEFLVPKDQIPKYSGSLGAVFGIASILGPVLGGFLTSVTWRWCFWINLPVGGVAAILLLILTPKVPPAAERAKTWKGKILDLDPFGFIFIAPSIVCLLIAIEFGGTKYPWNSGTIIALFVLFGVFMIAFIGSQIWRGEEGTVPPKIFLQRTVLSSCIASVGIGGVLIIFSFYLPIWFQVIQGKSSESSGLSLIAELLSVVVAVIASGILVSAIGYYSPPLILGCAVAMVGAGLISTWTPSVGAGKWIGYQIVVGLGLGFALQAPLIATQNVLSRSEAPAGLALLNTFSSVGGTVFVPVAQSLLQTSLVKNLKPVLPNINPQTLAGQGAASLRTMVSGDQLGEVLRIYNDSLKNVWYLALGLAAATLISAFGIEWRSVKETKNKKKKDDEEKKLQAESEKRDEARGREETGESTEMKEITDTKEVTEVNK